MGVIVGMAILSILGATSSQLLGEEIKAWAPWLAKRLTDMALRRLPANLRIRFHEEWESHIAEVPGSFGKILVAIGFGFAAWRVRSEFLRRHVRNSHQKADNSRKISITPSAQTMGAHRRRVSTVNRTQPANREVAREELAELNKLIHRVQVDSGNDNKYQTLRFLQRLGRRRILEEYLSRAE